MTNTRNDQHLIERLRKFKLNDTLTLIVENNPIYQPDLRAEAYFAGIWPETGGPVAKTWLQADCPAAAPPHGAAVGSERAARTHRTNSHSQRQIA